MAGTQALYDALGGVSVTSLDSQTALAVQSLLESQNVPETAQVDDSDVFQCGKCKKQFNSLSDFFTHKQNRCTQGASGTVQRPAGAQQLATNPNSAFTSSVPHILNRQPQVSYSTVPASPLAQTSLQSIVLSEDLISFNTIDQNIQTSSFQVTTPIQGSGPFLSQLGPLTPRTSATTNTSLNTAVTSSFSSNTSAFTSTIAGNQLTLQPTSLQQISQPQTVAATATIADKTVVLPVAKPSPTKAGQKSLVGGLSLLTDIDGSPVKVRRGRVAGGAVTLEEVSAAGKKKLQCQYCDRAFSKNFDLQQHIRSHTGEKPFQCIVCGRAFAQKSNVKKHMQTHKVWPTGSGTTLPKQPPPKPLADQYTEEAVPPAPETVELQTEGLNTTVHMNIVPNTEDDGSRMNIVIDNSYLCQYCPEKFKTYFQLKSHMVMHKQEQVYKCVLKSCGETYLELDAFLEHTKSHEEDMTYRCHMCNKNFPSLYELGVHQYSHSLYPNQGPKPKPKYFRCAKCNNKYATPESLEHHLQTTSHKYPCPHCEKMFTCERYLRRHLPTHGTLGEYLCETCHKCFKTEHYLKMHRLTHSNEKPFKCEQCDGAFNRRDKLKRHLLIHEPNKKYKCPFRTHTGCTKEFNRPDKLKAHIIAHSGIKPYRCRECGRAFSRRPHMVEHERSHHNDFKFRCEKCSRGFFREKLYKDHKCRVDASGEVTEIKPRPQMYLKRGSRRRVGRPRKKVITITEETLKENAAAARLVRTRGRPRRPALVGHQTSHVQSQLQTPSSVTSMVSKPSPSSTSASGTQIVSSNPNTLSSQTITISSMGSNNLDSGTLTLPPGLPQEIHVQITPAPGSVGSDPLAGDGMATAQVITIEPGSFNTDLGASELTTSQAFEHQLQAVQVNSGDMSALGHATLIATCPNIATLVVNNGEIIAGDGGTSIVTVPSSSAQYVTAEQIAEYQTQDAESVFQTANGYLQTSGEFHSASEIQGSSIPSSAELHSAHNLQHATDLHSSTDIQTINLVSSADLESSVVLESSAELKMSDSNLHVTGMKVPQKLEETITSEGDIPPMAGNVILTKKECIGSESTS